MHTDTARHNPNLGLSQAKPTESGAMQRAKTRPVDAGPDDPKVHNLRRLDTSPDLGLETSLDGRHRVARTARFARDEKQSVLFAEQGVGRFTDLAGDVFDCRVSTDRTWTSSRRCGLRATVRVGVAV